MKKFCEFLFEEWIDTKRIKGKPVELFRNPSMDELKRVEALNEYRHARGFIKPNGSLYVWDAFKPHEYILYEFGILQHDGSSYENVENGVPVHLVEDQVFLSSIFSSIDLAKEEFETRVRELFDLCKEKNSFLGFNYKIISV